MEKIRRIDLGEYIIDIEYNEKTGLLDVTILDELENIIESVTITNDNEDDIDPTLN